MADNEKLPNGTDEISIMDEEAITEINIGNFLNDRNSDAVLYEGFHEDIKKTEQSLEDEIQSLMDSIMSTGPVTIVPKPMDSLVSEAKKESSPMGDLWMSPEEYIDVPAAPVIKKEKSAAPPVPVPKVEKDEIFSMIDALKSETESAETGYTEILAGIEKNEGLNPVNMATDYQPPKAADDIDIHSADFDKELAILLGDLPEEKPQTPVQQPAPKAPEAETESNEIYSGAPLNNQPDNGYDISSGNQEGYYDEPEEISFEILDEVGQQETPRVYVDSLTPNAGKTIGVVPTEIYEDDGKISRKEKRNARKLAKNPDADVESSGGAGDIIRKIILVVAIITIIVSSGVLLYTYLINGMITKKNYQAVGDLYTPSNTGEASTEVVEENSKYPAGMLAKYTQLYDQNPDIAGWISIKALDINLPIVKATAEEEALDGKNNSFYLRRNFYKKSNEYGVPFFDSRIEDLTSLPRNTVVYGHNMHYDNLIFGLLENYREIEGYKSAPVIECNTIYGDYKWKVYAVFFTGSLASHDNGYMFSYNFLDISDEKFEGYIEEINKRRLYDTGVDINTSDKILTLSTCAYDFDGERLVVVARMVREGESDQVDTSKVTKNNNVKYPQAWYDANHKENPFKGQNSWQP